MNNILFYIKILAIGVLVAAIGAGIWYFKWSQNEIKTCRENTATLKLAVEQSEKTIDQLTKYIKKAEEETNKVHKKFQDSQRQVIVLRDKLSKHDLGVLARAKPKLIEKRVNSGSADMNRCIEILSGSPLTKAEKEATKRSEINTSCPDIANPSYKEVEK